MGVSIEYLYEKSSHLYRMELIGGKSGVDHPVEWIHMLESPDSAFFLHGGELVFTTGVMSKGEAWLVDFVRQLHLHGGAGVVFNIGPYIKKVPQEAVRYCDEHAFPLFVLPWSVHLVDITRYLCRFIINEEKQRLSILNLLQQILIMPEQGKSICLSLENQGFSAAGRFRAAIIWSKSREYDQDAIMALLKMWNNHVIVFSYHDDLVVVLTEASYEAERRITEELYAYLTSRVKKVCISIGAAVSHITELSCSYAQAHTIVHLACKKGKHIFFYEELGIYKLLLEGNNPALLQDYYNEVLGALETHDAMHNANLTDTLYYYLMHDCNVKETAAHEYVHRNTIMYKLNKIGSIIGMDIAVEENKLAILMAFKIRDIEFQK